MTTASLVREYRAAMASIKAPAKPQDPKRVPNRVPPGPGTQRQRVLDAAAKLYRPGDVVSPKRICDETGINKAAMSSTISYFRRVGMWPYAMIGRGRKGK